MLNIQRVVNLLLIVNLLHVVIRYRDDPCSKSIFLGTIGFLEYVNGVFQTGFLYFGFGGVGNGGLERGWGGVGEGLGRGWGGGWGRVGAGLGRASISILQKPRLKNPVNVP